MENQSENVDAKMDQRKQEIALYQDKKNKVTKLFQSYQEQITRALPSFLKPQMVIQAALTCMMKKPELMDCTGHSLIACVLTASQMGLVFDDFRGEAYLIPFNNGKKGVKEAQFIPGYKGLCIMAKRTGQVKSIKAMAVYDGDHFVHEEGLNDKLEHKPCGEEDVSKITHFYAIIKYLNGGYEFYVMTRKKVDETRNESKNYMNAPNKATTVWAKKYDEMGKKTVLRRLLKLCELSPEITKALALDEAAEMGVQNISTDWLDELPEFAEDIDHEIVVEDSVNTSEKREEQLSSKKEATQIKADAATKKTEELLAGKVNAGIKANKINPK